LTLFEELIGKTTNLTLLRPSSPIEMAINAWEDANTSSASKTFDRASQTSVSRPV